jgi:hypothetical protein
MIESKMRLVVRDVASEYELLVLLANATFGDIAIHAELGSKVDAIYDEFNTYCDQGGEACGAIAAALLPGQVAYEIGVKSVEPNAAHRLMAFLRQGGKSVDAIYFPMHS